MVCKPNGRKSGANLKAHIASQAFPREIPVRGRFFLNAVFNHFPLGDFSQTNGNQLVGAPRAHFRQKLKRTNSPNSSRACSSDTHLDTVVCEDSTPKKSPSTKLRLVTFFLAVITSGLNSSAHCLVPYALPLWSLIYVCAGAKPP